jgi:hypothetical protein
VQKKHHILLTNCLAPSIADLVMQQQTVIQTFPCVAIMFICFHDFDSYVYNNSQPLDLFESLKQTIAKLDDIVVMYQKSITKVEHVQGDYIVASSIVHESGKQIGRSDSPEYRALTIKALINFARHVFGYFHAEQVSSTRQLLVHLFRCTNNPQTCLPKTTCNTPQTEHTNSNTDTENTNSNTDTDTQTTETANANYELQKIRRLTVCMCV